MMRLSDKYYDMLVGYEKILQGTNRCEDLSLSERKT